MLLRQSPTFPMNLEPPYNPNINNTCMLNLRLLYYFVCINKNHKYDAKINVWVLPCIYSYVHVLMTAYEPCWPAN